MMAQRQLTPTDLVESELEFRNPEDPFEENERPELDSQTQQALSTYRKNPTEENKQALLDMMGVKYDKVVARKKAKLRELEREAKHQDLVDEMQAIVDEMVDNREIRRPRPLSRLPTATGSARTTRSTPIVCPQRKTGYLELATCPRM